MVEIALEPSIAINQMPDWQKYSHFMSRIYGEAKGLPNVLFDREIGEFTQVGICQSGVAPTGRVFELPDHVLLTDFLTGMTNGRYKLASPVILNSDTGELERVA